MRHLKRFFPLMLMILSLALAGCGSSSSGSTPNDPLAPTDSGTDPGSGTAVNSGVIMFTSSASLSPGGQTNMLEPYAGVVDPAVTPSVSVLQPIPFKLTDSNGQPRVGVPVTFYVYSITSLDPGDVTINFLVPTTIDGTIIGTNPEPNQQTITTDSAGMGIFNVATNIASPASGSFTAVTVVFKAVTNDTVPVTAYVGRIYSLTTPTTP